MSEKPKKIPSRLRKWGIRLFLLLLILLAGFFLFIAVIANAIAEVGEWFESAPNYELVDEDAREFIEGQFFLLPENASDFYLYYFSMQDYEAYIRFNATPEAFEAWFDSLELCFDRLSRMGQLYNRTREILSWWKPTIDLPNTELESCRTSGNALNFREISVDKRDAESWIIYIFMYNI